MSPRFLVRTDESAVLVTPAGVARRVAWAVVEAVHAARAAGTVLHPDVVDWTRELCALSDFADASSDPSSDDLPSFDTPSSVIGPSAGAQYDIATAAVHLCCTPRNVVDLVHRGVLAGEKRGGRWYVDAASVDDRRSRRTLNEQR